ncbi:MAG: DUF1294 domain-containing protein [Acholeplasmatales bacterium]|nr:DUF1294 domain-containing protein [Acholeplasmatales bacterium]
MYNNIIVVAYIAWLALASLCAFYLYCKDKKMAQKNSGPNRIKEKTLLSIACMGGAIGSLLGRVVAHHKTDKVYFSFIINISLIVQIAGFIVLLLLAL